MLVGARTPIHLVAKQGRCELLKLLLQSLQAHACAACASECKEGADATQAGRMLCQDQCMQRSMQDDTMRDLSPAARELVRNVLNLRTKRGSTALMAACRRGHTEVAELLLEVIFLL